MPSYTCACGNLLYNSRIIHINESFMKKKKCTLQKQLYDILVVMSPLKMTLDKIAGGFCMHISLHFK